MYIFLYIIYNFFKGTHDLQGVTIRNTSKNTLCLQFKLAQGRQITDIYLDMRYGDKNYNEVVTNMTHSHFDECFDDIPPGNNWTLYICDGVLPNVKDTFSNPAVILHNISITGRIHIKPSMSSIIITRTSYHTIQISTSPGKLIK